jgi:tol-pal system protein YbgF
MKKGVFIPLCFIATTLGLGCAPVSVVSHVAQLQAQYKQLQQDYADLYAKTDASSASLITLNACVQDLQDKISGPSQTVQISENNLCKEDKEDEGKNNYKKPVLPSSIYQGAYGDYSRGKYDIACLGFQSFLNKYPNAELAPQAQFYAGECFYLRDLFDEALKEYEKVEEHYKISGLVPPARLKMAMCYEMLGEIDKSSSILSSILKDFPQSPEALRAKEKIRINKNAQTI